MSTAATDGASSHRMIVAVGEAAMFNRVRSAIRMLCGVGGISVVSPKKTYMELALWEMIAGRITEWNSVDDLFRTVLKKWAIGFLSGNRLAHRKNILTFANRRSQWMLWTRKS